MYSWRVLKWKVVFVEFHCFACMVSKIAIILSFVASNELVLATGLVFVLCSQVQLI